MLIFSSLFLQITKPISVAVVAVSFICLFTSCGVSPRHYRSYLFEDPSQSTPASKFVISGSNAINVSKGRRVKITLDEVRIGFVHREMKRYAGLGFDKDTGFFYEEFTKEEGLGGKELWLLAVAVPKDPTDPLGLKAQQLVYASSIKLDQESFSFLPIDDNEKMLFDIVANTSYRIDFRVYSVHGVEVKKAFLLTAKSSIGTWLWSSSKLLAQSTFKFLGDGLFTGLEAEAQQPLFFEQILLKANAELELLGAINLIAVDRRIQNAQDAYKQDPETPRTYILYDIVKSNMTGTVMGRSMLDSPRIAGR